MAHILICDDDLTFQLATKQVLTRMGKHHCHWAKNTDEARVFLAKHSIELLLLDIEMRTPREGLDFLPWLKENFPGLPLIVCSGRSDFESIKCALQGGAWDYLRKGCEPEHLIHVVSQALERSAERARAEIMQQEIRRNLSSDRIIGKSETVVKLREKLERFKRSDAPVLIWGETGTGKELIARSLRPIREDGSLGPFVSVDSATIMESTAESMLFGHEKGAFTGADRTRPGLFEQADGGVIFFDELANMPLSIQQKLLRVLQEKEVTRMGSERSIKLHFRVVAATNQDLEALVVSGKFQADLLQRLNVLPIQLPPLRDRREDIESLVVHFLKKSTHSSTRVLSPEALVLLQRYSWPGNIRELQNVIEYAITMTDQKVLDPGDLPERIRAHLNPESQKEASTFYEKIIRFERSLLEEALQGPYTSVSELATQLGMDRSHLYTKLKQHGLKA